MSRREAAGSRGGAALNFWSDCQSVRPKAAATVLHPQRPCTEGSRSSTSRHRLSSSSFLTTAVSGGCAAAPHFGRDLRFPKLVTLGIFSCARWPFTYLLWRNVLSEAFALMYVCVYVCIYFLSLPFLNGVVCLSVVTFFMHFRYEALSKYTICKYFLPFCRVSFPFLDSVL